MKQGYYLDCATGNEEWFDNDLLHREDGPAIIMGNGSKF